MLSITTALKLRDAGFKAYDSKGYEGIVCARQFCSEIGHNEDCAVPGTDDFIDALGDKFNGLIRKSPDVWEAWCYGFNTPVRAKSGTEALARLWLLLNSRRKV